jgi:hypothetical protein
MRRYRKVNLKEDPVGGSMEEDIDSLMSNLAMFKENEDQSFLKMRKK